MGSAWANGAPEGTANARARAELLGGHLELTTPTGGGKRFDWRAPITAPETGDL